MEETDKLITWSYGGGVQSIAIACLIEMGKLPMPDHILIADTSREGTATWEYLNNVVNPMLGGNVEIIPHSYATIDLYATSGKPLIPAFSFNGMLKNYCSHEWKKRPIRRRLRELGYGPKNPCITWIGFSLEEAVRRAKPSDVNWQRYKWPLITDKPMTREQCIQLIKSQGLPDPPKSSCWMCPYRRGYQWIDLKQNYPNDFKKACELEKEIWENDKEGGLYLTKHRRFLSEIEFDGQFEINYTQPCESGLCFV